MEVIVSLLVLVNVFVIVFILDFIFRFVYKFLYLMDNMFVGYVENCLFYFNVLDFDIYNLRGKLEDKYVY